MKKVFQIKKAVLLVVAVLFSAAAFAQKPIPSPRDSVSGVIKGSTISINYGSPSVKGRKVFGELEKYGKVWRAGANEATVFTTSKNIMVEGKTLPAGSYGLFAIPTEGKWTIIFNKVAKQWGAFKYDESQDALRVMVTPKKASKSERLVYKIDKNGFSLNWDTVSVPVSIK